VQICANNYIGHPEHATLSHLSYVVDNAEDKSFRASALIKMASHYALVEREEECEDFFGKSEKIWGDNVDLWNQRGQVIKTFFFVNICEYLHTYLT
jgi:hypothetical protein